MDRSLVRRILITVVGLAVVRLGYHVPLPGIDLSGILGFQTSSGGIFALPGWSTVLPLRVSIFSLGLLPYISASILLLLLSGLVRPLRRLRNGGWRERLTFDRLILALTGLLAVIHGYGTAATLRNLLADWGVASATEGIFFFPVVILTMTCGTLFLVWLAHLITRFGVGNGVLLIVVTTMLVKLLIDIAHQIQMPLVPDAPIGHTVLFIVFSLAWVTALVLFTQARSTVALVRSSDTSSGKGAVPARADDETTPSTAGTDVRPAEPAAEPLLAPIRVNIAGVLPLIAAYTVWKFPFTIAALTGTSERFFPNPLGAFYWIVVCVLIVVFTYLLTAWIFNARDLVARAGRWGFRLAEFASPEEAARLLDRRVAISMMPASLMLCAIALAPTALFHWFDLQYGLTAHYGRDLLVIIAVAIALFRDLRERPREMEKDWVPLATFETVLETEMAEVLLDEHDIDSQPQANRVIPITGSLAPWEVCRPSCQSLVIHRRLGGGQATLWVPEESREAAARILAPYLDPEDAAIC
ncbi:MAG: hypothetical protein KAY32_07320 [Candidatus Eisenbacteria sp.]|nr:hypothetical protein [Candidatus Eisenbacteria bacterium]